MHYFVAAYTEAIPGYIITHEKNNMLIIRHCLEAGRGSK